MTMSGWRPAIELIGIDKRFGSVHANKDVNLSIAQGSIHGIIGENGAGKSTLMSILFGFYHADKGEIRIKGKPVKIKSSSDAISMGIGMVHQHFMLVDPFTVLENVVLGAEGGALIGPALDKARAELSSCERTMNWTSIPTRSSGTPRWPAAARRNPEGPVQGRRNPDPRRAHRRADAGRGRSPVPHPRHAARPGQDRHPHHPQAARDHGHYRSCVGHAAGEMVATLETKNTSVEQLADAMVGRHVLLRVEKGKPNPGEVILDVRNLTWKDKKGVARVDNVSFRCGRARSSALPAYRAMASRNCSRSSAAS
jgi:general nucleoside transport system ATP-binding protein